MNTITQIKEWRLSHNLPQRTLATAAGVTRNTYASWERRNHTPDNKYIKKINNWIKYYYPEKRQSFLYRFVRWLKK